MRSNTSSQALFGRRRFVERWGKESQGKKEEVCVSGSIRFGFAEFFFKLNQLNMLVQILFYPKSKLTQPVSILIGCNKLQIDFMYESCLPSLSFWIINAFSQLILISQSHPSYKIAKACRSFHTSTHKNAWIY